MTKYGVLRDRHLVTFWVYIADFISHFSPLLQCLGSQIVYFSDTNLSSLYTHTIKHTLFSASLSAVNINFQRFAEKKHQMFV